MIKKIFYIVFLWGFILSSAYSQQMPLYSQYMMNGFLLNPAVAGSEGYTAVNLTAREQWIGLPGSPKTHSISAQTRIMKNSFINKGNSVRIHRKSASRSGRVGLGGYIFNDINGPVSRTGVQVTYAYHIRMQNSQLSFGLSGVGYQFSLNREKIKLEEEDEFWNNSPKALFIPDANFGVYFTLPDLYCGISVYQLFQSSLRLGEKSYAEYRTLRNYNMMAGYDFHVNDNLTIEPSFLLKTNENFMVQADISSKVIYNEDYWAGLSYRTSGAMIFMGGVRVDKFFFGYAFDYSLSSIMKHSFGSHELIVVMKLGDNSRRYRWLNRF